MEEVGQSEEGQYGGRFVQHEEGGDVGEGRGAQALEVGVQAAGKPAGCAGEDCVGAAGLG